MWASLLKGILFAVISYFLTPKPEQPKPSESIDGVPRSVEGDPILIAFGSPWILSPQVAWYMKEPTEAIVDNTKK